MVSSSHCRQPKGLSLIVVLGVLLPWFLNIYCYPNHNNNNKWVPQQQYTKQNEQTDDDLPPPGTDVISLTSSFRDIPSMKATAVFQSIVLAFHQRTRDHKPTSTVEELIQSFNNVTAESKIRIGVHTSIGIDIQYISSILDTTNNETHIRLEKMDRPQADCWLGNIFE